MAAVSNGQEAMESQSESHDNCVPDRLKRLYPNVDENVTPLPRAWSSRDKYQFIGLSQNNLRVHYKETGERPTPSEPRRTEGAPGFAAHLPGHGKMSKDAASVRATHPIPAACGLYYFEVRIVSKGREGYMGIGLSGNNVNMNRLPGWDKHSYGYHGDDGNSFCSSGSGQPYGPTFTTGDVIGCGVNMIDNTCFYTKNGHHLGIAFRDLPINLFPTVGLQTPGEILDTNFGQEPFMFDIEDMLRELRARTRLTIDQFPEPQANGEWQNILHKIVSTYLVHHGYCSTAEAFARSTGQEFDEEVTSIKNRQKILKLVLAGRMGDAIENTMRQYPGLLERNPDLLFVLKCRQFIEMVNGSDSEICPSRNRTATFPTVPPSLVRPLSPRAPSPVQTSVIQSTKTYCSKTKNGTSIEELNQNNALNGASAKIVSAMADDSDVEMETSNGHTTITNGSPSNNTNGYQNGNGVQNITLNGSSKSPLGPIRIEEPNEDIEEDEEEMEVDNNIKQLCGGQTGGIERMLEFGRELFQLSQKIQRENPTASNHNQKMLEDAFSLLAYSNPWASPLGWQLNPARREPVCAALNSAILDSLNQPWRPPLEVATMHAWDLLRRMVTNGLGAHCAFVTVEDLLRH